MSEGIVLLVHCIDTEGPLYESTHAKFDRLKDLFNITNIPVNEKNLNKLKNREFDLNGNDSVYDLLKGDHLTVSYLMNFLTNGEGIQAFPSDPLSSINWEKN